MKLTERVIIVTGASAGIGRATAALLVRKGASVVVTARRQERLEKLAAELAEFPGKLRIAPGDIQEASFADRLVDQAVSEFGRLDVLVNNAGIGYRGSLVDMPVEDMHTIIRTNVLGLLYLSQAAARQMKAQGGGQIINVSSIAGDRPLPQSGLYCASKAAVNFISRSLRMELRPHNIRVTTVYPGRTLTEFGEARLGLKGGHPSRLGRVSAERVGRAIVRGIEKQGEEIYITWYDWLFVQLNRLFPRSIDWVIQWAMMRRSMMRK